MQHSNDNKQTRKKKSLLIQGLFSSMFAGNPAEGGAGHHADPEA
jgi:hypothetical protein